MNVLYGLMHWRDSAVYLLSKMHFLSDETFIKCNYWLIFGKTINIDNPTTFNEKIQWLKLHDRNPLYHEYVDKFLVRGFIKSRIGEQYLIPLIGVYDRFEDIDFSILPNQFVIKCTHDSGSVSICKDKNSFDVIKCRKKINQKLKRSLFWWGREWVYKDLKPRIIIEKYMVDSKNNELRDYKFFCFHGVVKFYKIDFNRFVKHQANYYSPTGELLPFEENEVPRDPDALIEIPGTVKQMISLAEILAVGIPFVRVDFYDVDGEIYFGEMTFYPAAGFEIIRPIEWDERIGSMLKLPTDR